MVSLRRADSHPLWLAKPVFAFYVELCSPMLAPSLATLKKQTGRHIGVRGNKNRQTGIPSRMHRKEEEELRPKSPGAGWRGGGSSFKDMDIITCHALRWRSTRHSDRGLSCFEAFTHEESLENEL